MSEVAQAIHSSPDGHIPQLRFPDFSGEWMTDELSNLIEISSNKFNPNTSNESKKCIELEHLSQETGELLGYTDSTAQASTKNAFTKGQVLFGKLRPYLKKFWLSQFDGVCSSEIWVLNGKKLANNYLFQFIQTNKFNQIANVSSGSKMPRSDWKYMVQVPFKYTTKPEQQKIAAFLTEVDNKIEQLSKKQELLGEYKKGAMQQIFSQATRFKADDGSNFPDWEEVKLGNLTHKVGKKNKENIKYPIYSINNQEGFRPQSEQFDGLDSNDRGYDISLYKIVNEKTFAYNPARINVGSIGYSYNLNKVIVSSLYVCFKTNDELEDLYLLAYLDTDKFNKDILRYEEGGVRQYLFYENFSQISIPLPGNDEQAKISNFLSSIDNKIEQVDKQLDESKQFKKALLQQMFV